MGLIKVNGESSVIFLILTKTKSTIDETTSFKSSLFFPDLLPIAFLFYKQS